MHEGSQFWLIHVWFWTIMQLLFEWFDLVCLKTYDVRRNSRLQVKANALYSETTMTHFFIAAESALQFVLTEK